jgi:hypothetical protein
MPNKNNVLLLLSGGKDSRLALSILLGQGYNVKCLCFDGIEGKEKIGAIKTAKEFEVELVVQKVPLFSESSWNLFVLIFRNLMSLYFLVKWSRFFDCSIMACGVHRFDVENPKLWWMKRFLCIAKRILSAFGLTLIFPVWDVYV